MLRGMIFDLDGTLADTLPICCEAFRRAAEPLVGKRYTDEEIHATFGPSENGSVHVLAPGRGDECLAAYLRHYEELHDACREVFPGIRELLQDLRANGVKLAVVTGKGPGTCEISLRLLGLEGFFDAVEWGCADRPCKPEAIRRVLESWEMAPSEAAYVGDSPSDVDSARAAGVLPLGAAWAATADAEAIAAKGPEEVFRETEALRRWVVRW